MSRTLAGIPLILLAAGIAAHGQPIWSGYARDPQHTGLSSVGSQKLEQIKWSTPVDQILANTPGALLVHYGSPMVTAANTVIVPVRTSSANTYQVEARNGSDGSLKYTLTTDYTPPPHNWVPSYGPALTPGNRLYYPGAGGTVYYRDQPDSLTGATGQIAFYGTSTYNSNQQALNSNVMISTPIVSDASGNIFFGFVVLAGPNPANLVSGIARISSAGVGSWVSASAAAGNDSSIVQVPLNCTPALSNDGNTLYFAASGGDSQAGYLVSVNSQTLAPIAHVRLTDPKLAVDSILPDNSSASPTIGPDGDVYYGVYEDFCCYTHSRGWLLHFDSTLTQTKTPGAFGWDSTASIVPAGLVPSYHGASTYLILTKYNNYPERGGDGHNKVAILDPNTPAVDPITSTNVMSEVITVLGVTLDPPGNMMGEVKEWCINSAAIDPFTKSAIINSEDGVVYRWDFTSNTLSEQVRLTPGVGEAYTPTVIGADGTSYAINDGLLFAVGAVPFLKITKSHAGHFQQGQNGATYSISVSNTSGSGSLGTVTVTDTTPAGLSIISMSGTGWTCAGGNSCTRNDSLTGNSTFPPITVTVNVAGNASSPQINAAGVTGGGSPADNTTDSTIILSGVPVLSVVKSHVGSFVLGQQGATYSVTVSNATGATTTSGTVTVTDTVPSGLSLVSLSGTGWTCPSNGNTCTRGDSLSGGSSYPPITVTVNVAANASSPQVNQVAVSGGGSANANGSDSTVITATGSSGLQLVPVAPCRLMDTRGLGFSGAFGPPSLAANSTRDLLVPSSSCGIPSSARAYSLNITVIPKAGTLAYLTVWPTGQARPLVSTLNSWDGSVLANAAIVPAGTNGGVSIFVTDSADLVVDINGYFAAPDINSLQFYPLPPCRVADTRNAAGTFGGPFIAGNSSRAFPVTASPCGAPPAARAYSLNVTAVPHGGLLYLTAWPTGQGQPLVSTLNSYDGNVLANAAIVPAGTNGSVSFYAANDTDLVVDIDGYFAPPGAGGLNFYPVTPCRVADTRNANGTFGGPILTDGVARAFPLPQSACGLPGSAGAYSLNLTALPTGVLYFLSVWPAGLPWPGVSTLNDYKGLAVANAALVPAGTNGGINVLMSNVPAHVIVDANGYFAQ